MLVLGDRGVAMRLGIRYVRVLSVNVSGRDRTRAKGRDCYGPCLRGVRRVASAVVVTQIALITQRSLVQIQPPQP